MVADGACVTLPNSVLSRGRRVWYYTMTGLLSNQGEKSINFYFIMVPFKGKSIKV